MEKIILTLDQLGVAIEELHLINEHNRYEKLLQNVCYEFKKEGINFNCELYIDSNNLIHVTKINGEELETELTIDSELESDLKNAYNFFAIFYNFLPTINCFEVFSTAKIDIDNSKYESFCIDKERLYFFGLSEKTEKDIEQSDITYYDKIKIIPISDITYISLDYYEVMHYLCLSTKYSICNVQSKCLNDCEAEELISLKNRINISLVK